MDLRGISTFTDYFVIGSANSDRQINAIVDHIREEIRDQSMIYPSRIEGTGDSGWVLIDYDEVIIHIFMPQLRAYYDLEGLWHEAKYLLRVQ